MPESLSHLTSICCLLALIRLIEMQAQALRNPDSNTDDIPASRDFSRGLQVYALKQHHLQDRQRTTIENIIRKDLSRSTVKLFRHVTFLRCRYRTAKSSAQREHDIQSR